jgi:metallophosphoesterase (TIGR03768 family)
LFFKPGKDIADVDIVAMNQSPGWTCIDEERIGVIPHQTLMKYHYLFSRKGRNSVMKFSCQSNGFQGRGRGKGFAFTPFTLLSGLMMITLSGCGFFPTELEEYPIASEVYTTRQKTVVPDDTPWGLDTIYPYEVAKYTQQGYGVWQYGNGVDAGKVTDLMPTDYDADSVTNSAKLLTFFAITDIHITDEETPCQVIYYGYKAGGGVASSAYSPVMMYSTQVLDAAAQTINALHQQNPFDFGISLGDACNSTQYNETRWYIDVLDGKDINPDSGDKDDPVAGRYNDYQDEFKAVGLDKSIPWYQTLGNHDHFWIGTYPVDDYLRNTYIGKDILCTGNVFTDPLNALNQRYYYMGAIDGRTVYGDIIGVGPVENFTTPPKVLASDSNRRSLTRVEWMNEFFNTSSTPVGHGFNQTDANNGFACYSFIPNADVPIKVIVLDDTQSETDGNYIDAPDYGHGSLDETRYNWLVSELDAGQAANQLMIIAAHIPIAVEPENSAMGWWSAHAYVNQTDLLAKLHTYPNLILWIAGHRHFNQVTALPYNASDSDDHPELSFWQVETSSLRDWPQQFRTFEIVRNSDNTISIITTDVDPAVADGSLAAQSRSYAVAAQQLFGNPIPDQPTGSYNAELIKQLSTDMQTVIQNYGTTLPHE